VNRVFYLRKETHVGSPLFRVKLSVKRGRQGEEGGRSHARMAKRAVADRTEGTLLGRLHSRTMAGLQRLRVDHERSTDKRQSGLRRNWHCRG